MYRNGTEKHTPASFPVAASLCFGVGNEGERDTGGGKEERGGGVLGVSPYDVFSDGDMYATMVFLFIYLFSNW